MRRFITTLFLTSVLFGGAWIFYHRDEIGSPQQLWDFVLAKINLSESSLPQRVPSQLSSWPMLEKTPDTIRVANFSLVSPTAFESGESEQFAAERLAGILQAFDVVAIPEMTPSNRRLLMLAVALLNVQGGQFISTTGPEYSGPRGHATSAFVFNQLTVQMEHAFPMPLMGEDLAFESQPYVGWFRALGAPADRAFTFTLVNIQLAARQSAGHVSALSELFRTVRNDRRNEDDVVICGDFRVNFGGDRLTNQLSGLVGVFPNAVPNHQGEPQYDNFLVSPQATTEVTGSIGQIDFLRQFNLTITEACQISSKTPIWVEFSVFEGGTKDRTATPQFLSLPK